MQEHVWEREYKSPKLVTGGTEPQVSVKDFLRWLRREQGQPLENLNVLDLGCGNGKNSNYICSLDKTNRAVGLDISETALIEARTRAYDMEAEEQTNFIKHDIGQQLPFPTNAAFDVVLDVTSSNSLDEKGRATYLREVHRLLKNGDSTPGTGAGNGGYFFVRALCKDGDTNAQNLLKMNPGPEHDTYIMPGLGLTERVFSRDDFIQTYSPLFKIHKLEKETHYTKFAGRSYKRNFWIAYLQK